MNNWAITYDEIIEETAPTNFNKNKETCKTQNKLEQALYWQYKSKMSNKVKYISIKNCTYYFFDGIINIKFFDPYNIKINDTTIHNHAKIFIHFTTLDK